VKNSWTSPKRIAMELRRAQALKYRMAGLSYPQIGRRMGMSTTRVFEYIDEAMKEAAKDRVGCYGL
jgi:hypothetical protein